ncbi:MAG: hypothetical protein ACM336_05500 [Acidobacteriota bacterium]
MAIVTRLLSAVGLSTGLLSAADFPNAEIDNGQIRVKLYLPDAKTGFYRGTRFDWSGVIHSLTYRQHDYYGPWFQQSRPDVHDFVYEDAGVIAGPCSAVTGPVDEFAPLGWDEARPGATFVKIGVGALRKPADGKYDNYRLYEIAGGGKWNIEKRRDAVEFIHELDDRSSGYGYVYRKAVRLVKDKPEMLLEYSLKNTGTRAIRTTVYNHNFLVLDKQAPGPGFTITVPFEIEKPRSLNPELAEVRGNQIVYLKTLEGSDTVSMPVRGFGSDARDNEIRIENSKLGAGMSVRTDRPLLREGLWSIRTVISMEPFIAIEIDPGHEFTWTSTYNYYTLPQQ